ncbi:MAG: choice-of-anchor D domain-containing protein [Terriglobales bacterium]
MNTLTGHRKHGRLNSWLPARLGASVNASLVLLLLGLIGLSGCAGSSNSGDSPPATQLSGNWQFTMQAPPDGSFVGGLQGGFVIREGGSVTGAAVFSIALPQPPPTPPIVCSSGSAGISGTINGQNVNLTALAGNQTFTLTGALSGNNSTLTGTYSSTAGTAADGSPCGTAQTGLSWSAFLVPPIAGIVQGNFHSTQGGTNFRNQDFAVSGTFTQGPNTGASNATVTGTLLFQDPTTFANDYPCLTQASVNGQISGDVVTLQMFASNGLDIGQIGGISASAPVTFDSTQGGYVLHNLGSTGVGYAVINTKGCPGVSLLNPGDSGDVCLAFGTSVACTQAITLSPFALTFPAQLLGSTPTSQTITLTNTDPSGTTLNGLNLSFIENDSDLFYANDGGDFNGVRNFTEQDSCATPFGSPFTLAPQQSCSITITFSPQESCPWIPFGSLPDGDAPAKCPSSLTAIVTVNNVPKIVDQDGSFSVPIKGSPLSVLSPSTPELDFGSEAVGESSLAQALAFTNSGVNPVQILSAANTPCTYSTQAGELPHPLINDGSVAGIQIARTDPQGATIFPDQANNTVEYYCDADSQSNHPDFQISLNTCLGRLLAPQQSCNLQVTFVPQPGADLSGVLGNGLDYFLELNTLQCVSPSSPACEIDGGRFPVEVKTNPPSPLRMSPAASLTFAPQPKGVSSAPQILTLYNDPADPNTQTVNFAGKLVQGDYTETDTCPFSLTPGNSCTLTVIFTPIVTGNDPGGITLSYNNGQLQTIYLRGSGK